MESALRALTDRHPDLTTLVWGKDGAINPVMVVFLNDHQLAAAEDAEILAKLASTNVEVVRLSDAERAAFVKASQPVLDRHRKELDAKLFEFLGS